jgi:hypothetical protein
MKNRFLLLVFLPTVVLCVVAFWIRGVLLLDPDFGWHLRIGEIIQRTGIPKTDPFSYTMPSYPFVDHEWLTNVALSKLYSLVDITGLAIIFSLLATLALLMQVPFPIKKWSFVPFALVAGSLLYFVGIRPQIISWVFFSILIAVLFNSKVWKWRFTLPLIFIAWANLHGGFGIGLVVLLVVTAMRTWEQKRILLADTVILLLCTTFTLINPYGIHLWRELWVQISDTSLRWNISEWRPALFTFSFTFWILVSISVLTIIRYRKKFYLSQLALYFILLIAGLSSIRHLPFWLLLILPMTTNSIAWFAKEAKSYKDGIERLNKAYAIFAVGVVLAVIAEGVVNLEGARSFQEETFYPKQAVEFLATQRSCGQLFSTYGWGGYLIWKLPEKKVFIDGRMPSWRWKSAPHLESNYAFEEYNKVLEGEIPIKHVTAKYNIDTFLLPVGKKRNIPPFLEKLQERLETSLNRKTDGYREFIKKIADNGMVEVYKDDTAVIYRQKENSIRCANPI